MQDNCILKMLKYRKSEFIGLLATQLGMFIFFSIILRIIMAVDNDTTVFMIGTNISVMVMIFMTVPMGTIQFMSNFNVSISMGMIRKEYIFSYAVVTFIDILLGLLITYIFYFIENVEINTIYSSFEREVGIEGILFSKYLIPIMIFMVSFVMLMGTLLLKYGNKMRIVLFVVWITFCMSFSRMADVMSGDSNGLLDGVFFKIGHYFTTSNSILIISEIIILSVLFMGISSRLLMKQKVT